MSAQLTRGLCSVQESGLPAGVLAMVQELERLKAKHLIQVRQLQQKIEDTRRAGTEQLLKARRVLLWLLCRGHNQAMAGVVRPLTVFRRCIVRWHTECAAAQASLADTVNVCSVR